MTPETHFVERGIPTPAPPPHPGVCLEVSLEAAAVRVQGTSSRQWAAHTHHYTKCDPGRDWTCRALGALATEAALLLPLSLSSTSSSPRRTKGGGFISGESILEIMMLIASILSFLHHCLKFPSGTFSSASGCREHHFHTQQLVLLRKTHAFHVFLQRKRFASV